MCLQTLNQRLFSANVCAKHTEKHSTEKLLTLIEAAGRCWAELQAIYGIELLMKPREGDFKVMAKTSNSSNTQPVFQDFFQHFNEPLRFLLPTNDQGFHDLQILNSAFGEVF
jgi:hypothetical protein